MKEPEVVPFPDFVNRLKEGMKINGVRQTPKGGQVVTFGPKPGASNPLPQLYEVEFGSLENPVTFPFGLSQPQVSNRTLTRNDPYNLDIQIPIKEEPDSEFVAACYKLDETMIKSLMEEWETIDGTSPERVIVERAYRKVTVNLPPNDIEKRKAFDPNKYNPSLRIKFVIPSMEQKCFRVHDSWQPTDSEVTVYPAGVTSIQPWDTGVLKVSFSGLWRMNGQFGFLAYASSIILLPRKSTNPLQFASMRVKLGPNPESEYGQNYIEDIPSSGPAPKDPDAEGTSGGPGDAINPPKQEEGEASTSVTDTPAPVAPAPSKGAVSENKDAKRRREQSDEEEEDHSDDDEEDVSDHEMQQRKKQKNEAKGSSRTSKGSAGLSSLPKPKSLPSSKSSSASAPAGNASGGKSVTRPQQGSKEIDTLKAAKAQKKAGAN